MNKINNLTFVDLNNYLKHKQHYLKLIDSQQQQQNRLLTKLNQIQQENQQQIQELKQKLTLLNSISGLTYEHLAQFKQFYTIPNNGTINLNLLVNTIKNIVRLIIINLYQLPVFELELLSQPTEEHDVHIIISVDTYGGQFNTKEKYCQFLINMLTQFIKQFNLDSKVNYQYQQSSLEISIVIQRLTIQI